MRSLLLDDLFLGPPPVIRCSGAAMGLCLDHGTRRDRLGERMLEDGFWRATTEMVGSVSLLGASFGDWLGAGQLLNKGLCCVVTRRWMPDDLLPGVKDRRTV